MVQEEKILDYARSRDLMLVITCYAKSDEKTYTYKIDLNQRVIDYIIILWEHFGNVKGFKLILGEPIAPQRVFLVMG